MFFRNLSKKSDEDVVTMIQRGDHAALTELYRRYSTPLLRYFYRMLWKDKPLAQDFVHDLFIKIIQRNETVDTNKRFSTWIYSVAHNMCKNEYRRRAFRSSLHPTDSGVFYCAHATGSDDSHAFNLTLENVLSTLDPDEKHLFVLRFELDLPLDQIALMVDCPEGTVKSRIFSLKKKLAAELTELNPLAKTNKI